MGGVNISPNLKKTSHRIMPDGRVMDVPSRRIVGNVKEEEEFQPPVAVEQPPVQVADLIPISDVPAQLSLAEQIKEAEAHLAALRSLKAAEIAKKKKELEELEKL